MTYFVVPIPTLLSHEAIIAATEIPVHFLCWGTCDNCGKNLLPVQVYHHHEKNVWQDDKEGSHHGTDCYHLCKYTLIVSRMLVKKANMTLINPIWHTIYHHFSLSFSLLVDNLLPFNPNNSILVHHIPSELMLLKGLATISDFYASEVNGHACWIVSWGLWSLKWGDQCID